MILDNKQNGLIGEALKKYLAKDASLSVVTNRFSIYAYQKLQKEFDQLHDVRLLFGSPCFDTATPSTLLGDENEIVERNKMQQKFIAKECAK